MKKLSAEINVLKKQLFGLRCLLVLGSANVGNFAKIIKEIKSKIRVLSKQRSYEEIKKCK